MSKDNPCIAIDAMGGDYAPQETVAGAVHAARHRDIPVLLVGLEEAIKPELDKHPGDYKNIEIVHASQVAEMDEKPSDILRRKKDSSIQVANRMVKEGRAGGVVSAGNTGACLACGIFVMGRVENVERPAIASYLPTEKGRMILIDAGANVDCKPHHLAQFGIMAHVMAKYILGIHNPRVGLLSIGEEEGKGNTQVKEAYDLLRKSSLNFLGNVEGRDIFSGNVDIVVCDGFVGNVVLKLAEGLGVSLTRYLKNELKRSAISMLGGLLSLKAFKSVARLVDYAEYGGAPLLGLKGISIVCHGASSAKAVSTAINVAATFVRNRAIEHLSQELALNQEIAQFARRVTPSQT